MPYIKVKYVPQDPELWVKVSDDQLLLPPWNLDDHMDHIHSNNDVQWVYREVVDELPPGEHAAGDISDF